MAFNLTNKRLDFRALRPDDKRPLCFKQSMVILLHVEMSTRLLKKGMMFLVQCLLTQSMIQIMNRNLDWEICITTNSHLT